MAFKKGFKKIAISSHALDLAGLGALSVPVASHMYNSATGRKPGKKEQVGMGAVELGGLVSLGASVLKAKKGH